MPSLAIRHSRSITAWGIGRKIVGLKVKIKDVPTTFQKQHFIICSSLKCCQLEYEVFVTFGVFNCRLFHLIGHHEKMFTVTGEANVIKY